MRHTLISSPKKWEFSISNFVQPVESGAMFISDWDGDPDDGDSFEARCVGEQLAEVFVVSLLQLILDQYPLCANMGETLLPH